MAFAPRFTLIAFRVYPEMLVAIPFVPLFALHHYQIWGWLQLSGNFLNRTSKFRD